MANRDWVLLTRLPLPQAQVLRGTLEDVGILAHIDAEEAQTLRPLAFQGASSARVLVPNDQLETAKEILDGLGTLAEQERKADPAYAENARQISRIGWFALVGFMCLPPLAIYSIVKGHSWLKRHPAKDAAGRTTVITALAVAYMTVGCYTLIPLLLLIGGYY